MWARIYLIPALQAEEDRDQVRRYLADRAREKELLGSETKVYHSDRYVGWALLCNSMQITNHSMAGSCDRLSLSHPRTKRNKEFIWREYVERGALAMYIVSLDGDGTTGLPVRNMQYQCFLSCSNMSKTCPGPLTAACSFARITSLHSSDRLNCVQTESTISLGSSKYKPLAQACISRT